MTRPIPTQSPLQKLVGFKILDCYSDVLQWRWGPIVYTRVGTALFVDVGPACFAQAGFFKIFELRWREKTVFESY